MVLKKFVPCLLVLLLLNGLAVAKTGARPGSKKVVKKTASATVKKSKVRKGKAGRKSARGSWKRRGQQAITSERTREIQQALIQARYLDGDATGVWDARTKEAMRRYQADNGWQTRVLPDSRALIKMGLGPRYETSLDVEQLERLQARGGESDSSAPR